MKSGKVWGITSALVKNPFCEVHHLQITPHSRCSRHHHVHKWNGFLVLSGKLSVAVEKADYSLTDVTVLGPGEWHEVKPGEVHWFQSHDDPVEAVEVYWPSPLAEDIVRRDVGSSE